MFYFYSKYKYRMLFITLIQLISFSKDFRRKQILSHYTITSTTSFGRDAYTLGLTLAYLTADK